MVEVRTALIGCGKVGQIHAEALGRLPESEFVAACDDQADRADALAAPVSARRLSHVAEMLLPRACRVR